MKTNIACIPCFIRQITEVVSIASKDKNTQLRLLKNSLAFLSGLSLYELKPPQVAKLIHNFIKNETGISDLYKDIKARSNKFARSLFKEMEDLVKKSQVPFETSLRLAIAGNIIDYGQAKDVNDDTIKKSIEDSLNAKLDLKTIEKLYKDLQNAKNILYLGDNAGEIYFDKLFISQIPNKSIIFAVRGKPIINDITIEDAIEAEIHRLCDIIDTGDATPGIILEDCSDNFIKIFSKADIIISKGQGNFETLFDVKDKKIYFLLKIKCDPVADIVGYKLGETAIICNKE